MASTSVELTSSGAPAPGSKKNEALADIEAQDIDDEKDWADRTLKTRIAQGVAGASVVVNIVAIALSPVIVVIVAGIIAMVIGVIAFLTQMKLEDTGSMREVQNKLRHNVNDLQVQNNKLSASNDRLEDEVTKLKEQEVRLQTITAEQGSNVDHLVGLVKENHEIQRQMKAALRAVTVQMLMKEILVSDANMDGTFDERELNRLKIRFKALSVSGVEINEELLMKKLKSISHSVDGVLKLGKEMADEDNSVPEDQQVFIFEK